MTLVRTLLFAALLSALALLPSRAAAAAETGPYVSLGDSYTAAPLVLPQVGTPVGCARSSNNYPSVVARALSIASFRDAAAPRPRPST